jgi:hypothetical protein
VELAVETIREAATFLRDHRVRGFGATQVLGRSAQCLVTLAGRQTGSARDETMARARAACRAAVRNGKAVPLGAAAAARARGSYEWLRGQPGPAHRAWSKAIALAEAIW